MCAEACEHEPPMEPKPATQWVALTCVYTIGSLKFVKVCSTVLKSKSLHKTWHRFYLAFPFNFALAVSVTVYSKTVLWRWFCLEGSTRFEKLYTESLWHLSFEYQCTATWPEYRQEFQATQEYLGGNAETAAKEPMSFPLAFRTLTTGIFDRKLSEPELLMDTTPNSTLQ